MTVGGRDSKENANPFAYTGLPLWQECQKCQEF